MEKDSKTTVAVERTTFAKLDRLAKANSVSKMEYITHAINYRCNHHNDTQHQRDKPNNNQYQSLGYSVPGLLRCWCRWHKVFQRACPWASWKLYQKAV
jgi:hypothetical protein